MGRNHLGLFIANKIARKHRGSLEIEATAKPPSTRFLITGVTSFDKLTDYRDVRAPEGFMQKPIDLVRFE